MYSDSSALRAARQAAGLTQAEAAAQLGVRAMRISMWERGESDPRPPYTRDLARLYGVEPQRLLAVEVRNTLLGARLCAGLTLAEVAEQVGLSAGTLSRLERIGGTIENPEHLAALARVLALTVRDTRTILQRG